MRSFPSPRAAGGTSPAWQRGLVPLVVLFAACAFADPGPRRGVRLGTPAAEQRPGTCPRLAGAYRRADNLLGDVLNGQRPYGRRPVPWGIVLVTQPGDSVLQFDFRGVDGLHDTVTLRQPGDFSCATGWFELRFGWEHLVPRNRAADDDRRSRLEFRIAADDDQALVGRLVERRFRQFDVWCGDGCRGFPIPGTVRRTVRYVRLLDTLAPLPEATPTPRASSPDWRADDAEAESSARLAAEAAALEQGPPPPPLAERVRAIVTGALPPAVQLLAVTVRGDSAKLSLAVPAPEALPELVRRLRSTPGIRTASPDPLERSRTADGGWGFSVWVQLESSPAP